MPFGKDASGNPVDAQGNPVVQPGQSNDGGQSIVAGYDANGYPIYDDSGKDLGHYNSGYLEGWTGESTPGGLISSGLSYVSPDIVNGLVGKIGGDSGGDGGAGEKAAQTRLAQETTKQSTDNAQAILGQALAQAGRAGAYQGPGAVTSPEIAGPDQLNRYDYQNIAPTTAEAVDATGRMRQAQTVDVAKVAPAMVDGVDVNINAPDLGQAAQTGRVEVGGVQADPLADAIRADQIRAAKDIATGPSAVMPTMQAGQTEVMRNALGVAARARGNERAGAAREAILAVEQGGLAASLKAAALSAEEEQAKRAATTAALGNIRSQDITSSGNRQAIEAQRNSLQAQLDAAIAQGNTEAANDIRTKQAQLEVEARKSEVAAGLSQQSTLADLSKANLGVEATRALTNAGATNTALGNFAASQNAAAESAAARQTSTNVSNTALGVQQAEANANRGLDVGKTNITNTQQTRTANAANQLDASKTTAGNQLTAEQIRNAGTSSALSAGTAATGIQSGNASTIVGANKSDAGASAADKAADRAMLGTIITAAAASSDERLKEDISPVGTGGSQVLDDFPERSRGMSNEKQQDLLSAMESLATSQTRPATQHNREWAQFQGEHARDKFDDLQAAYLLKKAAGRGDGGEMVAYSDESTKREVDGLDDQQIQDWAEDASKLPVTFRYKPGVEDGGQDPHLGVLAQDLEDTGHLGKIMVHKDDSGTRSVEYGSLGLMMGKAAFDRATEALSLARSLAAAANGGPPEDEDTSELGPALALAASRSERRKEVR